MVEVGDMSPSILVVDDDRVIRELIAAMLRDEGYEVTVAVDGDDALSQLDAGLRPGLILLDLMLPRLSAAEFVQALDARGIRGSTPVIVVSAAVDVMARARALGALAVVPKPFELDALLDAVDGALKVRA